MKNHLVIIKRLLVKMQKLSQEELNNLYKLIELKPIKPNENKLKYLTTAVQQFTEHIPFSNVFLLSTPPNVRRPLTFNEIKSNVFCGLGGFCQVNNSFFNSFLLTVGYETDLVNSSHTHIPNNHSVIIVKNVINEGDQFVVDVGSGYYLDPIELNFEDKSPTYQFAFATFQFGWDAKKENIIQYKINKNGEPQHIFSFNLTPFQNFDALSIQNLIYTDPKVTPFIKNLRIIRFPKTGSLCVNNQQFLKENEQHILQPEIDQFKNVDLFLECVQEHFPKMDLTKCKLAYQHLFNQN